MKQFLLTVFVLAAAAPLLPKSEANPFLGSLFGGNGRGKGGGFLGGLFGGGGLLGSLLGGNGGLLGSLLGGNGGLLGSLLGGDGGLLGGKKGLLAGLFAESVLTLLVADTLCGMDEAGLKDVVMLTDDLGVSDLLNIKKYVCKDGKKLFSHDSDSGPLDLNALLGNTLCALNFNSLGAVPQLIQDLDLHHFLNLADFECDDKSLLFP